MRAGTSLARSVQTGYLRDYALLLLLGVGGLALYFLIASTLMLTIHLSIVLFLPLAAGLAGALPAGARSAAGSCSAATVGVLGYAIALLADFDARRRRPPVRDRRRAGSPSSASATSSASTGSTCS